MRSSLWCLVLCGLALCPLSAGGEEDAVAPPAPYEIGPLDCGELDNQAGLRPLRPSHVAGEDSDILCKLTVTLSPKAKGAPKQHTITFSVFQGNKTTYQQVRDVRVLAPGSRTILFVVPAEKLPTEGGKVHIRAELSKPATKPNLREITYDLNAED